MKYIHADLTTGSPVNVGGEHAVMTMHKVVTGKSLVSVSIGEPPVFEVDYVASRGLVCFVRDSKKHVAFTTADRGISQDEFRRMCLDVFHWV